MRNDDVKKAIGGTVLEIKGSETDRRVLVLDTGTLELSLDAECCSCSHFTDPSQFNELLGSVITDAEEVSGGTPTATSMAVECQDDEQSWHFLRFTTNLGHVTIDWRNDSNGWYDGELMARFVPAGAAA